MSRLPGLLKRRVRCVLAAEAAPRAWLELRALLGKKAQLSDEQGGLTEDPLRHIARAWLDGHRWIPEAIQTAALGDLEWQRGALPDHWIELDAVTGDDHERWPTSVYKQAFWHQRS